MENKENREHREIREDRENREDREYRGDRENREDREYRGDREIREDRENREDREIREEVEICESADSMEMPEDAGRSQSGKSVEIEEMPEYTQESPKAETVHDIEREIEETNWNRETQENGEHGKNRKGGGNDPMARQRKKKKMTGSFAAKVVAFFLLAICVFLASVSGLVTMYMVSEDYYGSELTEIFLNECSGSLFRDIHTVQNYIASGDLGYAKSVCERKNLDIALLPGDLRRDNGSATDNPALIWSTYSDDYEIGLTMDYYLQFSQDMLTGTNKVGYQRIYPQKDYVFRVYFNMEFPERDRYADIYSMCRAMYNLRYVVIWVLGISIFLGLNSFLFLMCSAGWRNDAEGIQPSVFSSIPLDLYTAVYAAGAFFLLLVGLNTLNNGIWAVLFFSVLASAAALWCTFYLRELAVRMKMGYWWRNTIVYRVLRLLKKIAGFFWRGVMGTITGIPRILDTMIVFCGVAILEVVAMGMFCIILGADPGDLWILWFLKKIILFPIVVWVALMCRKLLKGSAAMAENGQEAHVDTAGMVGGFKECGENLNNIGQGIARAVAERLKSERLKTELITNVTHDIKTPLTSIINYANLIAEEPTENGKIAEYSEVLVRQSARLKKLLEDLLEASKATTGNLEVDIQICEVGVILSQAIGEYQRRMEEKQLELIVTQPEQPVRIMADGRHLWRVFDNLLNNICKYAREDSRVYLSVATEGKNVDIIFRNMSKYALNVTPEELQERFVRGDRSRHMEGNGLGLSIAKSLMELQNGRMEVVTDGDLFKVILRFEMI